MARTPGIFSAAAVSSLITRPLAIVASMGTAYSIPGRWKSAVYFACPVTFSGPSTRGVRRPIGEGVEASCVGGMVPPARELGGHCGLEGMNEAALSEFDFEAVFALPLGVAQGCLGRLAKLVPSGRLADQHGLGLRGTPRLGPDTPQ